MGITALIDADLIVYRVGFAYENEPSEDLVKWQVDQTIAGMCKDTEAERYEAYITSTDKSNFRFQVSSVYKANRTQPRPKWYDTIRNHLLTEHDANEICGMEADDALGIRATELKEDCVIVSIDKDLLQIPGRHYHFVKREFCSISEDQGWYNFYTQTLVGDRSDNVEGIRGIGPKKASKLLEGVVSPVRLYKKCLEEYVKHYKEEGEQQLEKAASLLYILRAEGDKWKPPSGSDAPS